MSDNIFDYIIIGGGTAGCLLANRLSANASKRVLLIEAGRKDDYHWIHIPVGYLYCIGNPRTDWLYKTEADPGLNGRALRYPRGKALGGSSSINGMIYMRGQARDYERWADLTGDDAWRWDSALASFKQHENHYKLDASHGPVSDDFKRLHGHKSQPGAVHLFDHVRKEIGDLLIVVGHVPDEREVVAQIRRGHARSRFAGRRAAPHESENDWCRHQGEPFCERVHG